MTKRLTDGQIAQRFTQHARAVGHGLTDFCGLCYARWGHILPVTLVTAKEPIAVPVTYACNDCGLRFNYDPSRWPVPSWLNLADAIRRGLPWYLRWLPGVRAASQRIGLKLMNEAAKRHCAMGHPGETPPVKATPTNTGFVDAKPLTFRDFQGANEKRVIAFRMNLDDWSLREWCCELAEETGEVCGIAKKMARKPHPDKPGHDIAGKPRPTAAMLADEIGDVITVAALVASRAGIDLEQAVRAKWSVVSERVRWPHSL